MHIYIHIYIYICLYINNGLNRENIYNNMNNIHNEFVVTPADTANR